MRRTMFRHACLSIAPFALAASVFAGGSGGPVAQPPETIAAPDPAAEIFAVSPGSELLDPCAVGEYLARLPACLRSQGCEAHELWDRLVGEPGLRVATPQTPGPGAIQLVRGRQGSSSAVLRLPSGGEPSAARGPAGNLDEVRLLFGPAYPAVRYDLRTAPPVKPCPADR